MLELNAPVDEPAHLLRGIEKDPILVEPLDAFFSRFEHLQDTVIGV